MNQTLIGLLFILAGIAYGSLAIDDIYNKTLGWLVANNWVKPSLTQKLDKNSLGRKPTILLYSLGLIIIGVFILWNKIG
ncbi:MAG: hypothetical protein KGJ93_02015 [Patescibacteria group bacterium]|nr:hypothetical protein [Patescibacteria group bacterium]